MSFAGSAKLGELDERVDGLEKWRELVEVRLERLEHRALEASRQGCFCLLVSPDGLGRIRMQVRGPG